MTEQTMRETRVTVADLKPTYLPMGNEIFRPAVIMPRGSTVRVGTEIFLTEEDAISAAEKWLNTEEKSKAVPLRRAAYRVTQTMAAGLGLYSVFALSQLFFGDFR